MKLIVYKVTFSARRKNLTDAESDKLCEQITEVFQRVMSALDADARYSVEAEEL